MDRMVALWNRDDMGRMSVCMIAMSAICVVGILASMISQTTGVGDQHAIARSAMAVGMIPTLAGLFYVIRSIVAGR